ncbi:MAG: adenosylcobinamide-phosphate synthase CbiB [Lachnospiraceae bacterium]|nr:adenosylcobinamide-phosphate synthase CbiB [Lachnospiraceae bacterium]
MTIWEYQCIVVMAASLLDVLFGDPEWMPHFIRIMGKAIALGTKWIRAGLPKTAYYERLGGKLLVIFMLLLFGLPCLGILYGTYLIDPALSVVIGSIIGYQMLAMKDLKKESMNVYRALANKSEDSIQNGRKAVARIVGRDTAQLDEKGIIKATVETVAENTSDGVIAPLLYLAIGGPVLGVLYKVVNTMDSMIGYKNEEYLHFGRAAAKMDDVWNYVPARLAAYAMVLASGILGYGIRDAYRIYKRDRYCHASPNSAQTEAVMAGALGVQLAGDAYYFGKLYQKPTIGDVRRDITCEDIKRANMLLYVTALVLFTGILFIYKFLI